MKLTPNHIHIAALRRPVKITWSELPPEAKDQLLKNSIQKYNPRAKRGFIILMGDEDMIQLEQTDTGARTQFWRSKHPEVLDQLLAIMDAKQ
jgi:hypothetical protein